MSELQVGNPAPISRCLPMAARPSHYPISKAANWSYISTPRMTHQVVRLNPADSATRSGNSINSTSALSAFRATASKATTNSGRNTTSLSARLRRRRQGLRGLRRLERKIHDGQEIYGHRTLNLPHRRAGQNRASLARREGRGPYRRRPRSGLFASKSRLIKKGPNRGLFFKSLKLIQQPRARASEPAIHPRLYRGDHGHAKSAYPYDRGRSGLHRE